jgi:polygalacturonase
VDGCQFQAPSGATPNDHAPSSDGIDVDSDQNVTISHCSFSVGDDDIALKGSKGPFAMQDKDSPPVEHIRIQDCTFAAGGGIVTVGSEATLVRDVVVQRCKATGRLPIVRLKLRPDTPQDYEDIHCSDITLDGGGTFIEVAPWRQYFDLQGQPAPKSIVRDVTISNVHGTYGSLGQIGGNPGDTISDIVFSDVNVTLKSNTLRANGVQGLKFTNVIVNGAPVSAPASAPPPATP